MLKQRTYRNIVDAIQRERIYQNRKWGTIEEHLHTIFEWIGIMEQELKEAKKSFFSKTR